jgi:hypothetical protein
MTPARKMSEKDLKPGSQEKSTVIMTSYIRMKTMNREPHLNEMKQGP